jgi:hypothetical protein
MLGERLGTERRLHVGEQRGRVLRVVAEPLAHQCVGVGDIGKGAIVVAAILVCLADLEAELDSFFLRRRRIGQGHFVGGDLHRIGR